MILTLALLADAHVPHDLVVAAVGTPGGPLYAIAEPGDSSLLLRSDDEGRTWDLIGGDPTADRLLDIVIYDGAPVILGERYLWYQVAGEWASVAVPGHVTRMETGGDRLWVGGSDGLFTGPPDGLVRVLDAPVAMLAADPNGVVVRTSQDRLFIGADTFAPIEPPADAHLGPLLLDGAIVIAGATDGGVWRYDGAWTRFAGPQEDTEHPQILGLAQQDGLLAVANAEGRLFTTADFAEWADLAAPVGTDWQGEGSVSTTADALTVLSAIDHRWLVGGWAGLAYGDKGAWRPAALLLPEYTRGVAFSPHFANDGVILWGTYSGGVLRTDDGGATFRYGSDGLDAPNVQDVKVSNINGNSVRYAIVGHHLWQSVEGRDWERIETPFSSDASVFPLTDADRMWVAGGDGGAASLAATRDGGRTWDLAPAVAVALQGDVPRRVFHHRGLLCVGSANGRLVCSGDGGQTFDLRFHGLPEMTSPVSIDDRIVLADVSGVHYSDDSGVTWTDLPLDPTDPPEELIKAGDTLWLATASARLLRSYDHGETWDDVGVQLPANVFDLVARPDYEAHPDLIVGTPAGMFRVTDGDDVDVERFGGIQRVECGSTDFSQCDGCGAPQADSRAAFGSLQRVPAGGALTANVRGTTIRIIGDANGSDGSVRIDGGESIELHGGFGELAVIEGLDDGIHHVTITVTDGDGVLVDAIEAGRPHSALVYDDEKKGCATVPEAGWAALCGALGLLLRRKPR